MSIPDRPWLELIVPRHQIALSGHPALLQARCQKTRKPLSAARMLIDYTNNFGSPVAGADVVPGHDCLWSRRHLRAIRLASDTIAQLVAYAARLAAATNGTIVLLRSVVPHAFWLAPTAHG